MRFDAIREGNMISVGPADGGVVPPDLADQLGRALSFSYRTMRRPTDRRYDGGPSGGVKVERVDLYRVDAAGRYATTAGFLPRVRAIVEAAGHELGCRESEAHRAMQARLPARRHEADWDGLVHRLRHHGEDLRFRQDELLAALDAHERGIVDAPPGIGKSFIIRCYCLANPRARIHVVNDSTEVLGRLHDDMIRFFPDLGMVGDGKKKWGRVTLVSAKSVHHADFDDPNSHRFADTVLADEVHRLAAPDHYRKLLRYQYARMFGLTATTASRFDGADIALEGLFGSAVFYMSYEEAAAHGLVVPIEVEWLVHDGPDVVGNLTHPAAVKRHGVWRHRARNKLIMDRVALADPDEQVLVLADTIEHVLHLKAWAPDVPAVYSDDGMTEAEYAGYVRDGLLDPARDPPMTRDRMRWLRQEFAAGRLKRAIANTVWDTGVDFPQLETLVVAHGSSSRTKAVQGPGRVSRTSTATGKTAGRVIDVYDVWNNAFRLRSLERSRHYASQKWAQTGIPRRNSSRDGL